jgi:probable phosphoglycerate mutase
MQLIFVRHGDAHAGLRGVISGPIGCRGLTDLGRRQATALRDAIQATIDGTVDAVLVSKLPRAIETAEIVAPALGFDEVLQDCDLCEMHTGDADGLDWVEYSRRYGAVDMISEPDRPFAPGGESWTGFHERVEHLMDRLARDHPGERVMAFCHAGVIAASMRIRFASPLAGGPRLVPTNTGLTRWAFDEQTAQWTLRSYDDTRHLGL